jgi:16S rRNA (guanine527-N7)-methyltransferase
VDKLLEIPEDWEVRLKSGLRKLAIESSPPIRSKILRHAALVRRECLRMNLVSQRDREFLIERHVLPSLAALPFVDDLPLGAICIGSGAGFPGIDIKIFRPKMELTLLEATKKKADFLRRVVADLRLSGVEVIWNRAESLDRAKFELAFARGVAPMAKLQDLAAPLLEENGKLIAWKGSRFLQEMQALRKPKFEIEKVQEYDPPRILVILRKI